MEEENGKLDMASGGEEKPHHISKEDEKLLKAFHSLPFTPKVENSDDLMAMMRMMGKMTMGGEPSPAPVEQTKKYNFPRLPTFFGELNKGDVSWPTFKYEVDSLVADDVFNQDQILYGIRRALKGKASDHLRRAGTGLTLDTAIRKLEREFGSIETPESVLQKLYSVEQKQNEDVATYAARLEDLHELAFELGGIQYRDEERMKKLLFKGLKQNLKQMAGYKFDTVNDYDIFKIELRKMEAEISPTGTDAKKCHAINPEKPKSELSEVKDLLLKLNERVGRLESEKKEDSQSEPYRGGFYRGYRRGDHRGYGRDDHGQGGYSGNYRGRGSFHNSNPRGRGNYMPQRPLATNTFRPEQICYNCGYKGHIAKNCPKA